MVNLIYTYILHTRTVKAFLQFLRSYISVKKEIAVHITSSIILRRHGFFWTISTREIEKRGERYKKYVNLYKYKFKSNRIASYIKEHQRHQEAPWSKNTKWKGYTIKSCEEIRRISSQTKIVSHHFLTLETENKKTHPGNTSHTLWKSHTQQRAFLDETVGPLQCGLATQSVRALEKWRNIWSDVLNSSGKDWTGKNERAAPVCLISMIELWKQGSSSKFDVLHLENRFIWAAHWRHWLCLHAGYWLSSCWSHHLPHSWQRARKPSLTLPLH